MRHTFNYIGLTPLAFINWAQMPHPWGSNPFDRDRLVQMTCCLTIIIRTLNTGAQVYYSAPIYTFHLFLEPQQRDGCFTDREMEDREKKIKLFTHLRLRPRSKLEFSWISIIYDICAYRSLTAPYGMSNIAIKQVLLH